CAADGENLLVTEVWTDAAGRRMPVQVDLTVPAGTAAVAGTGQVQITRTTGTDTDTGWVSKAAASAKVVGSPTTATASAPAVAAANRAGFLPGGTYSPWRTMDSTGGSNRYWLNYNTEAQYYGVYSANRPELAEPYYRVIQAEIPYSRNRTHAAGYEGVTFTR